MAVPQRLVLLLAVGIVALTGAALSLHADSGYRYFGLRRAEVPRHYVSLDSSSISPDGGHVAAWVGANQGLARWVQGGVLDMGAGPAAYIEEKRRQPPLYTLEQWPTSFGHRVRVRVFKDHHGRWRVEVAGHISRSVLLRSPSPLSVLETFGDAEGTATIDNRAVSSSP